MASIVEQASDYSFARRPKWIVSHIAVLLLFGSMVVAGIWQINRHFERGEQNDVVAARTADDPVPLATIAPPGSAVEIGESEQFRRVSLRGEFQTSDEVLIRNRSLDGAPGWWVLTPFLTEDGWGAAVNRGWIPLNFEADAARPGTEAPSGQIEIVGTVQPARVAEGFQVADPAEGRLLTLGRADVERLAQQVEYELSSVVVQIEAVSVGSPELPVGLPLPALDAGPHASYAVQWFIFSAIALAGYPLVLRRVAGGRASSAPEWDD